MAADRPRIANNPLQLLNHRLGNTDIIQVNLKAECPGGVGHLPPFLKRHAVAEVFNHPANRRHRPLALVDPERIADRLALIPL